MKLLTLKQTSTRQTDVVFRNPSMSTSIAAVIMWALLAVDVYLLVEGRIHAFAMPRGLSGVIAPFALLIAWMLTQRWRASRRPSNWLLRLQGNDVLIKFRSFENWRMSEDDLQVIELHRDEIAVVRERRERQVNRDSDHGTITCHRTYLELELKNRESSAIEKALAAERAAPGWGNDRHHAKVLAYPVAAENGVLRLTWRSESSSVRPGIKQALASMSQLAPIGETVKDTEDFTPAALRKLGEAEQRTRLVELARRNKLAAIETARELFHCSTAKANGMVEDLLMADSGANVVTATKSS
jgi:hypothetical protein